MKTFFTFDMMHTFKIWYLIISKVFPEENIENWVQYVAQYPDTSV